MKLITFGKKNQPGETGKPYLKGNAADGQTLRESLRFFGVMLLVFFVSFISCSSISAAGAVLRIAFSVAVILLIIFILFNNGLNKGADAVARGEILYQREQKGEPFTDAERKCSFHPAKGFVTGLIGSLPYLILAVLLACVTQVQMTEAGTLPTWMKSYAGRGDIGSALINYTQPEGMTFISYIRLTVRICILPFVNLAGSDNSKGLYLIERLSPLLLLLPAIAYGCGYNYGRTARTKIHSVISENNRKRRKKEEKERRRRTQSSRNREPEQLN